MSVRVTQSRVLPVRLSAEHRISRRTYRPSTNGSHLAIADHAHQTIRDHRAYLIPAFRRCLPLRGRAVVVQLDGIGPLSALPGHRRPHNSREEAELVKLLADLGIHGAVNLAPTPDGCEELSKRLRERIATARARFEELAGTRTSLEDKRSEVVDLLLRWFVQGRQANSSSIQ